MRYKLTFSLAVLIFMIILTFACEKEKNLPDNQILLPFETAKISESGLRLTFKSLIEDSRCPEDVNCITAGKVVVVVNFFSDDADQWDGTFTMDIDHPELASQIYGDYKYTLIEVSPHPNTNNVVTEKDYVILIMIERL